MTFYAKINKVLNFAVKLHLVRQTDRYEERDDNMILQYKSFNNNGWCYEEADKITVSTVGFSPEKKEEMYKEIDKVKKNKNMWSPLDEITAIHDYIENMIKCETKCDEISWKLIRDKLQNINNFIVITLEGCPRQDKNITYVFEQNHGIYLLNDYGKTVQRL